MGRYYLLVKKNQVYVTTSRDYTNRAMKQGFKYCGNISGWNIGRNSEVKLLSEVLK